MEVKPEQPGNKRPGWLPGTKCCSCKKNVRYVQPPRVESYRPSTDYKVPKEALSGATIYNKSYKDFDLHELSKCKGSQVHPKDNLTSAGDFQSDTTHKMSFGSWEGYTRSPKFWPKDHCLIGIGPLQDMTTNRHDYTPKFIDRPGKIKPPGCLGMSERAMETNTTNTLSYGWPDNYEASTSYKPQQRYLPPSNKMEQDTIQKTSFRPWEYQKKEKFPWAEKGKYNTPSVPMHGETIYNNSFYAPGKYVEDPACRECYCKVVGECLDSEGNPPKAHEYNSCPVGTDRHENYVCPEENNPKTDISHENPT